MTTPVASELDPVTEGIASRFITAVEQADFDTILDEIYAPDAVIWHNNDNVCIGPTENIRVLTWLHGVVTDLRYEDVRRLPTPKGYVQQHTLRAVTPAGDPIEVHACFVVTIENGRIVRLDEYLDKAASRPLDPYRPTA